MRFLDGCAGSVQIILFDCRFKVFDVFVCQDFSKPSFMDRRPSQLMILLRLRAFSTVPVILQERIRRLSTFPVLLEVTVKVRLVPAILLRQLRQHPAPFPPFIDLRFTFQDRFQHLPPFIPLLFCFFGYFSIERFNRIFCRLCHFFLHCLHEPVIFKAFRDTVLSVQ